MNEKKQSYVKPQMQLLEVDVKTSILTGSGDPTITNPEMGWGANERRDSWVNFW